MNPLARLAAVAVVVVLATGIAVLTIRPGGNVGAPVPSPSPTVSLSPSPDPSSTDSPGPATIPPNHPTPRPVFPGAPLDEPPGEALPADMLGRTYVADPPESHLEAGQMLVLTLRPADDPHCAALYEGQSTCFTYLWTPNWPKHVTDPAARGAARIVGGNLVLRFDLVPMDPECEGKSSSYAIEDGGATLAGIVTAACTVPGFREQ